MFGGIAKITEGFHKKELKTWQKWSNIGVVGALTIAVANTIIVVTVFGIDLVGVIFGFVLIIMGIQIISSGITKKQKIPRKYQTLDLPKQARFIYHDHLGYSILKVQSRPVISVQNNPIVAYVKNFVSMQFQAKK